MSISLGAIFGGPESTLAKNVCDLMTIAFAANRAADGPLLNVVFHFPGSVLKPSYSGLRTGRFSKNERIFMIQVAVPESVSDSNDVAQIAEFMLGAIKQALKLSQSRWDKHGVSFPFVRANEVVQAVALDLSARSAQL